MESCNLPDKEFKIVAVRITLRCKKTEKDNLVKSGKQHMNEMSLTERLSSHSAVSPGFPVLLSSGVCSNSCSLSQWCHPIISAYVAPFSSCPQSFPASVSFLMSQLFASGGQSIRASASALIPPMNIQGWFPLINREVVILEKIFWTGFLQDGLVGSPCNPGIFENMLFFSFF